MRGRKDQAETIGTNGRTYPHKFDHEKARQLRAKGMRLHAIARHLGVTITAVDRVTNPRRAAQMRLTSWANQQKGVCIDCGVRISSNYMHPAQRCQPCNGRSLATSVRDTELRCTTCREWKPDTCFYQSSTPRLAHRRNRRHQCKECENASRKAYRERTGR